MDDLLLYNPAKVADRIDKILNEKKIIKKEMLKELGLSINTTSNMKNGRTLASDSLAKIADYIGVSTDFLLGRSDDPALQQQKKPALNEDELDSREQEILTLLRAVPEDRREEAERAVMALIAGLKDRL